MPGKKPSPEAESDEDLKLLAMSGFDSAPIPGRRVLPQIDKILGSAKEFAEAEGTGVVRARAKAKKRGKSARDADQSTRRAASILICS